MKNNNDDIIDVDPRSEVLKGKTPRRLLWLLGGAFIIALMSIAVIIVNNPDTSKKKREDDLIANAAKEAADANAKSIESIEQEQTKEALANVRGNVKAEIDKLKGPGVPSNSAVQQTIVAPAPRDPAIDAAARLKERIMTASIFKGSAKVSQGGPPQQESEIDMLKRLTAINETAQLKASQLSGANASAIQAALAAPAPRTAAAAEIDFNAAMESKGLPQPTGILPKSKSQCLLTPGWLIPVANIETINADLPGDAIAVVREDVYDSLTNTCLAIPKGSKIMITYNPNVKVGQERFNIAASMLQLPNGKRVPMMGTSAYDTEGSAGVEADVNNHYFKMIGSSLLLGLIDRVSGNTTISTSSANGSTTSNSTVFGKVIGDAAQSLLERNKSITPTLTRPRGTRFNLKVTREFFMEPYRD